MSEYVSKENFEQYDSKLKEYIDETLLDNLDLLSYGVSWTTGLSDPHLTRVGNMTYHKTLPILNNMKGCIALMKDGPKIMYYLNPNNWGRRKDPIILKNKQINYNESKTKWLVVDDVFGTKLYTNCNLYILGYEFNIDSIDTENKTAEVSYHGIITDGNYYDIELGAVLSGYDGEVMVEVPEFWIKSWDGEDKKEVRISPTYIDDTWEHLQHCLVGAYKETILREVPEGWGYLSTLPVNSGLSVTNYQGFCRGGANRKERDWLINSIACASDIDKPISNETLSNMRTRCRLSGKEVLNYLQYKRIMYWLYVIEYANFNSLESFNSVLTSEGFRQGGLGQGVTNMTSNNVIYTTSRYALIPKKITKKLGNNTGVVTWNTKIYTNLNRTETSTFTFYVPSWHGIHLPFGDVYTYLEGAIVKHENNLKYSTVYATDNPEFYGEDYNNMRKIGLEITISGTIKEFDLGGTAEIIPISLYNSYYLYKCDAKELNEIPTSGLSNIFVGGSAIHGSHAGLSLYRSDENINIKWYPYAFRSICIIK